MFETQVHVKPGFEDPFDGNRRLSTNEVFFGPGERTAVHEHTIRQLLSVTGVEGLIVSGGKRLEVGAGDLVSIPAEERHWHGAAPNSPLGHVSIVVKDDDNDGTVAVERPERSPSEWRPQNQ
ncbi:cupin domain-containing protein [Natronomonas gomsonensis]|uniref:cupin domain-containing protein n=1 Tax=Natronomonas gomsonensis TaxID=1046043 RepID=UPI0015B9EBD3|nr:cupin domain-containing protein [Natronomonas gomsonensis]